MAVKCRKPSATVSKVNTNVIGYLLLLWVDRYRAPPSGYLSFYRPYVSVTFATMQHHYFARYPTDEWHLANVFSLVYFSVVVCLRGLYHHILLATARALCQGQCTPHARFPLTKGGGLISGSPLLGRTGGVVELVLGSVFIIELDTGLAGIYFHRYYTEYDVCHKQNT